MKVEVHASNGLRFLEGAPGMSLMQLLRLHAVDGITADCSGAMSCGTCRCRITNGWGERLPVPCPGEREMLDALEDRDPRSRLTCQIELNEELDGLSIQVD